MLKVPIAVEIMGCSWQSWCSEAKRPVGELGHRFREQTGDSRSRSFQVERLATAIQRSNAASVIGTFALARSGEEFV